jgi:hypothetical protein
MVSQKDEQQPADKQTLEQAHNETQKRIYVCHIHAIHELYNDIADNDEKNCHHDKNREESADQCQIAVLEKLLEYFTQGPVQNEGERKSDNQNQQGEELIDEALQVPTYAENEHKKDNDEIYEIHKKRVPRRFFPTNVLYYLLGISYIHSQLMSKKKVGREIITDMIRSILEDRSDVVTDDLFIRRLASNTMKTKPVADILSTTDFHTTAVECDKDDKRLGRCIELLALINSIIDRQLSEHDTG